VDFPAVGCNLTGWRSLPGRFAELLQRYHPNFDGIGETVPQI
jgi:hypothetical protein